MNQLRHTDKSFSAVQTQQDYPKKILREESFAQPSLYLSGEATHHTLQEGWTSVEIKVRQMHTQRIFAMTPLDVFGLWGTFPLLRWTVSKILLLLYGSSMGLADEPTLVELLNAVEES